MARIKYYYDTETCKYERVKASAWEILLNFLGLFIVTLLIATGLVFLYIKVFPNKQVRKLKQQNKVLIAHKDSISKKISETEDYIEYLTYKDRNLYRAITGTELQDVERKLNQRQDYIDELKNGTEISTLIDRKSRLIDSIIEINNTQKATYEELIVQLRNRSKTLRGIPAIQPIENPKLKRLASGFGNRTHPLYKVKIKHLGVDFSAPEGTPVYATADGKVIVTDLEHKDAGLYVEIDHNNHFRTTYSHMQKFIVEEGQYVKRGELIGYVGTSGKALSSHLGYEIYFKGKRINPVHYFFIDTNSDNWHKLYELAKLNNQTLS